MQEWTILELVRKMETGELTSRRLAEMYLERIASLDKAGPGLNAVIETNPEALGIADHLDNERRDGRVLGPLHGIPVLLKDNIDTADRMQTTSGSLALEGNYAGQDAGLVARLRSAGALLLGKANLSEWANFRARNSSSGWSSRGGLTRNPYALDRTACGSSSGSAVAVAANLCSVAVGTETDGSIICPSQTNGIVGIKPTLGLISRSGVIPIAHSQDTAGPMARCVADAALLLGALAGVDDRDPATQAGVGKALGDYTPFLRADGLRGKRIGVARNLAGSDPRVLAVFETSLAQLKAAGAELVDPANVDSATRFGKGEITVLFYEFKADLNAYLGALKPEITVRSMADVIRFNEQNRPRVMPYFGQDRMLAAEKKGDLTQKRYLNALSKNLRLARQEGIDRTMSENRLDALVCPSGGAAWMIDLVNGDAGTWDVESTSLAAIAGYPHITVPAGYVFGLPVGLSIFASAWQEPTLIEIAYAFEQASPVRRPPQFLPTAALA